MLLGFTARAAQIHFHGLGVAFEVIHGLHVRDSKNDRARVAVIAAVAVGGASGCAARQSSKKSLPGLMALQEDGTEKWEVGADNSERALNHGPGENRCREVCKVLAVDSYPRGYHG